MKDKIKASINGALNLLNSELESVATEELREEYIETIKNLEKSLADLDKL